MTGGGGPRLVSALVGAVGLLAVAGCANGPDGANPQPSSLATFSASQLDPAAYAAQIVRGTNDARVTEGLPKLAGSTCAQAAGRQRATNLIGNLGLRHASLGGVIADCTPSTTAAENLSRATASAPAVMKAWLASPGHRSNLLDPALTQIGVGCVLDGKAMLCSQMFLGP